MSYFSILAEITCIQFNTVCNRGLMFSLFPQVTTRINESQLYSQGGSSSSNNNNNNNNSEANSRTNHDQHYSLHHHQQQQLHHHQHQQQQSSSSSSTTIPTVPNFLHQRQLANLSEWYISENAPPSTISTPPSIDHSPLPPLGYTRLPMLHSVIAQY